LRLERRRLGYAEHLERPGLGSRPAWRARVEGAGAEEGGDEMRLFLAWLMASAVGAQPPRFEVTFPASLEAGPITGRLFVTLFQRADIEPRIAAYQSARFRIGR